MPRRRSLALLAYDDLCTFEYAIAVELLARPRLDLTPSWYRTQIVNVEPGRRRIRGLGGIAVEGVGLAALRTADTIVIPGWRHRGAPPSPALLRALRAAAARGARLFSICSGVFLLARAGLLDGRRATTHWLWVPELIAAHPTITVEPDVLYVEDGNLLCSAGSAAGVDAGLHLIRSDFGAHVANVVARRIVAQPHRSGGQAQYVETPVPACAEPAVAEVLDWARQRLDRPLRIDELAARAMTSERTFLRRFVAAVGMTPKRWLQHERIGRARALLERTALTLDDVGGACGYQTTVAFRVAFRHQVGIAPGAYRDRFRVPEPGPDRRRSLPSGRRTGVAGAHGPYSAA